MVLAAAAVLALAACGERPAAERGPAPAGAPGATGTSNADGIRPELERRVVAGASLGSRPPAGPAPPEPGLFVDRAAASGLDFVHFNGSSGELYYSEIMGAGVAVFDYDNDGDLDVFLVQGQMLNPAKSPRQALSPPPPRMLPLRGQLYRNDLAVAADGSRRLSFTNVTEPSGLRSAAYGMGVATGDVDNDGWTDLYVTGAGRSQLFVNQGDGTFRDVTAESGTGDDRWSVAAAFVDFDRDGWLDLYVVHYVDFSIAHNKRCQSMAGAPDYCRPDDFKPVADRLLHNRGDGRFADVSATSNVLSETARGLGVVSGDFNDDGWPDLYVANDGMPNILWINRRDGTFENQGPASGTQVDAEGKPKAGMGLAAGDADGDGDEDLLVTNLALETNSYYRNDGTVLFTDASRESGLGRPSWSFTGFGTSWIDYDNDGWLDLLVVNGGVEKVPTLAALYDPQPLSMPKLLYHNRGGGHFAEVSKEGGPYFARREVGRGLAIGDLDNDGDSDAVVSNNGGPARLLLNQNRRRSHWLGLRLVGVAGRDSLGAWVEVLRSVPPVLRRRVRTDGSYLSASDPRLLFGLGGSPAVDGVRVRWPDGRVERFSAPADRYTTLREGTGKPATPPS